MSKRRKRKYDKRRDAPLGVREDAAEQQEPSSSLSELSWWMLLFVAAALFLYSFFTANLYVGIVALILAVLIEKRGSAVLLRKYNARLAARRAELGITELNPELRREVVRELRRERQERRRLRRGARESSDTKTGGGR